MTPLVPMTQLEPMQAVGTVTGNVKVKDNIGSSFEDMLQQAVGNAKALEDESNKASYDLATGQSDDLTSAMLSSVKAQTQIQLVTQVTSKAVSAYKEIMQMNL